MSAPIPIPTTSAANSRVLVIGDLHAPYHHPDALDFLYRIKQVYNPDRVISIGDETDGHRWSMHIPSPSTKGESDEYNAAKHFLYNLARLFPCMDILESNHGSLPYRKAHANGIPLEFIKNYNELWGVPETWNWHFDLTIELSNGRLCNFHHSRGANVLLNSQRLGMNAVQGHHHEKFGSQYWASPMGSYWGAQTGCLIDTKALAFHYGKNNVKRPILGALMILNGHPLSIPLLTNADGRMIK